METILKAALALTLSIGLTVAYPSWASISLCQPEPVLDPLVKGRAYNLHFPDGRKITVIGHIHGNRNIAYSMNRVASQETLKDLPQDTFDGMIRTVLNQGQRHSLFSFWKSPSLPTAVLNAQHDFQYLLSRLRSSAVGVDPIQFVGLESTTEDAPFILRENKVIHRQILKEFKRRKALGLTRLTDRDVNMALLTAANANLRLFALGLAPQKVKLIGPEDTKAVKRFQTAWGNFVDTNDKDRAIAELRKAEKNISDETRVKAIAYRKTIEAHRYKHNLNALLTGHAWEDLSPKQFRTQFDAIMRDSPSWLKEPLQRLRQTLTDMRVDQRDQKSASYLADLKQSGIHLIGLSHLKSITGFLVEECRGEMISNAQADLISDVQVVSETQPAEQ